MSTPVAEKFLAAFREFELSTVNLIVDVDFNGQVSCWYGLACLNPDFSDGQGVPMTVEFTIRPNDLAKFCNIMLWDLAEVVACRRHVYQGAGLKANPADDIEAAVKAAVTGVTPWNGDGRPSLPSK